jgi:hypothetical protein
MKRPLFWTGASLLTLWLLVPTTDVVSPRWTVYVTDAGWHPLEGAEVMVFSRQYTLETQDAETQKVTGKDGLVNFDERRIHAISLMRLFGVVRNLGQGAHASFGVHTNIHASKSGYGEPSELKLFGQNERESRANGAAQQSSHIVLLQCAPGYSGFGCSFPDDPAKPVPQLKF